ncbi:MAG TPA: FtsQ-type POTRA domain-containing protein [Candidatus Limnocylindrales bacterium]|nr:FtsQ-type POTRA domain-containing protein [Candidatus Limnocylindrales bacterium]
MIEYKAYHKRSLGKPRRKAHAARKKGKEKSAAAARINFRQVLPAAAAILAIILVTAAGAAVYSWLGHSRLFTVRDIDMNRCAYVTRDEVSGILSGVPQGNIWSLSSRAIGRRLLTHPWVRSVSVRKSFPDRLVVRIDERKPVAMINLDALYYVDGEGTIFKRLTAYDPKNFPIVTGFSRSELTARDAVTLQNLKKTLELLRCTESGALRQNVSEVHFDAQEGYTLVTRDSGLQLKIGMMECREAMKRIEEAMPKLSSVGQARGVVDLKTAGRIYVRPGE